MFVQVLEYLKEHFGGQLQKPGLGCIKHLDLRALGFQQPPFTHDRLVHCPVVALLVIERVVFVLVVRQRQRAEIRRQLAASREPALGGRKCHYLQAVSQEKGVLIVVPDENRAEKGVLTLWRSRVSNRDNTP